MVGHFVNRAHLEVLKSEDLEDQLRAKRLVDIICFSPTNNKRRFANILNYDH